MSSISIRQSSDPLLERRRLMRSPCSKPKPALFLDRDGVLIEDKHHLSNPDNVLLCPGAKTLLKNAFQQGLPVVMITNQSGIARGYFNWQDYERVTDRLLELLGSTAPLAGIYANGHGPNAPLTSWRKPSPEMLLTAAKDLNIDLSRSLLIGDRLSDLRAGASAGLPWLGHVLTGHGEKERHAIKHWFSQRDLITSTSPFFKLEYLNTLLDFPLHRLTCIG